MFISSSDDNVDFRSMSPERRAAAYIQLALVDTVDQERIPRELKDVDQWVNRAGKVPKQPSGRNASHSDPTTWSAFDDVYRSFAPIGYVFSEADPYVGIDFDGCRDPETGEIASWARNELDRLNSYSEISPSGTGIKTFVRADALEEGKELLVDAPSIEGKRAAIEVYSYIRYFTVTGCRLDEYSHGIEERRDVVGDILLKYKPAPRPVNESPRVPRVRSADDEHKVAERAAKYISRMPVAISGQGGDNATFKVACRLILGFDLDQETAFEVISEWNLACEPPWSEYRLRRNLERADKQPGERGYLRDEPLDKTDNVPFFEGPSKETFFPPAGQDPHATIGITTALIKGPGRALFRVAARCTAVVLLLMVEGR